MSDKRNNFAGRFCRPVLCILAMLAALPLGCETNGKWRTAKEDAPSPETKATQAPDESREKPAENSTTRLLPRRVAPEDVEAFQNAVERISRLEYGPAEAELRFLLVRFESVDDPKYVSQSLFWLGYCCEKQHATDLARDYYQRLIEHYPETRPGLLAKQRRKHLSPE
ncbi:MAG: tetratricopeptide repeat protein [Phycisphaerae bacterium]|nr:tetratricopeptide repeat protein [Phycisphaerae bacterium]